MLAPTRMQRGPPWMADTDPKLECMARRRGARDVRGAKSGPSMHTGLGLEASCEQQGQPDGVPAASLRLRFRSIRRTDRRTDHAEPVGHRVGAKGRPVADTYSQSAPPAVFDAFNCSNVEKNSLKNRLLFSSCTSGVSPLDAERGSRIASGRPEGSAQCYRAPSPVGDQGRGLPTEGPPDGLPAPSDGRAAMAENQRCASHPARAGRGSVQRRRSGGGSKCRVTGS